MTIWKRSVDAGRWVWNADLLLGWDQWALAVFVGIGWPGRRKLELGLCIGPLSFAVEVWRRMIWPAGERKP